MAKQLHLALIYLLSLPFLTLAQEPRDSTIADSIPPSADTTPGSSSDAPKENSPMRTSPPEMDIDLILNVIEAHRDNLQKIKTWKGTARLEQKHYETDHLTPQTPVQYERSVEIAFAVDREKDALLSRWTDNDPRQGFSHILLLDGDIFRYRSGPRHRQDRQEQPSLVIKPRSKNAARHFEAGDVYGFDPVTLMTNPDYAELQDDLRRYQQAARDPNAFRPWEVPHRVGREDSLVIIEHQSERRRWQYRLDLARGGNLVSYSNLGDGAWGRKIDLTYEQHEGIWLPTTVRKVDVREPIGSQPGQTEVTTVRLDAMLLNSPLDESTWTISGLGVGDHDFIDDRRGAIAILHEPENTRVPQAQDLEPPDLETQWRKSVREWIVGAYPALNEQERAQAQAVLEKFLPQGQEYLDKHRDDYAALQARARELLGSEHPRGSAQATELVADVQELNERWDKLQQPINDDLFGRLETDIRSIIETARRQRLPEANAAVEQITPEIAKQRMEAASKVKNVAQAWYTYAQRHQGSFPADLQELVQADLLEAKMLDTSPADQDAGGYSYIRPAGFDDTHLHPALQVLIYEQYDQWPQTGVAVSFVDSHAEWILDEAVFNRLLEATVVREKISSDPSSDGPPRRETRILMPNGQFSRTTSSLDSIEDQWQRYVRKFIDTYQLEQDQSESAWAVYRDLSFQARAYTRDRRDRFEELDHLLDRIRAMSQRPADGRPPHQQLDDLRRRRQELEQPLDNLFNQLKNRLERIPTTAQRQTAEQLPTGNG